MDAKTLRVPLDEAYALFFDEELCSIGRVFRYLVEVAHIEIAYSDEVVGELGRELMARYVVDLETPQIEEAGQTIEFLGVLNEVFPKAEFVVTLDPGNAGMRKASTEAAQDVFAYLNLKPEFLAATRYMVVLGDLPEVLEIAIQDEPVRLLSAEK